MDKDISDNNNNVAAMGGTPNVMRRNSDPLSGSSKQNIFMDRIPDREFDNGQGRFDNLPKRARSRSKDDIDHRINPGGDHGPVSNGPEMLNPAEHLDQLSIVVYSAIMGDDLETLKKIYKQRRVVLVDRNGNTPLHLAARKGNPQVIKFLLRHIPVDGKNARDETCAHHAAKLGNVKALKSIVYGGTVKPVTIACERDRHGMTILHLAAILGKHEVVTWLVDTFGKTLGIIRNNYQQVALHFAAAKGHVKCVQALCKLGKSVANVRDITGATAIFYACQEGFTQCLYYLVNTAKADLQICTDSGVSPLMAASQAGRLDAVKLILQREDDFVLDQQALDGSTVYHMAAANGNAQVLEYLLCQPGAQESARLCDVRGSSPAHDAAENGYLKCLKLLIAAGNDIHLQDEEGQTPYFLAMKSPNPECARYARSLTDGRVVDATSMFARVHSAVAADQLNRNSLEIERYHDQSPGDSSSTNGGNSIRKSKTKKLGFRRGKRPDDKPDANHVLQGEFVLKEHPSERNHEDSMRQHSRQPGLGPSRLKFKPTPLSFPGVEDFERDADAFDSDEDFSNGKWIPTDDTRFNNNNNHQENPGRRAFYGNGISLKPDHERGSHERDPFFYFTDDVDRELHARHMDTERERQVHIERSVSFQDAHRTDFFSASNHNATRWHPMSNLMRTPSSVRHPPNSVLPGSNHPSFNGPFHIDRGSRPSSRLLSRKLMNPPVPNQNESNHGQIHITGQTDDENIYEDTLDIEDVLDEMNGLYKSRMAYERAKGQLNKNTPSAKWSHKHGAVNPIHTENFMWKQDREFYYKGEFPNDRVSALKGTHSASNTPEEPPVDYSPLLAIKTPDVRVLPPVPSDSPHNSTIGTNFQVPPNPQNKTGMSSSTHVPQAPPPPPLPPDLPSNSKVKFADENVSTTFVELINAKKTQLNKTYISKRRSRARVRDNNRSHKHKRKSTVSAKIGDISDVLERAGLMAPYMDHLESKTGQMFVGYDSSDDSAMHTDRSMSSTGSSRDTSPNTEVSTSPLRELSPPSRFTYLPDGVLATPRLKKVDGEPANLHTSISVPDMGESDRLQQQRKSAVNQEIAMIARRLSQSRLHSQNQTEDTGDTTKTEPAVRKASMKNPIARISTVVNVDHSNSDMNRRDSTQTFQINITDDEYNKLQTTLMRRLERPPELPKLNMRTVRQYEKVPDPPSELELFFKKRREQLEKKQAHISQSSPTEGGDIAQGDIKSISRLVEREANVGKATK